jgi:hypothetical protein
MPFPTRTPLCLDLTNRAQEPSFDPSIRIEQKSIDEAVGRGDLSPATAESLGWWGICGSCASRPDAPETLPAHGIVFAVAGELLVLPPGCLYRQDLVARPPLTD